MRRFDVYWTLSNHGASQTHSCLRTGTWARLASLTGGTRPFSPKGATPSPAHLQDVLFSLVAQSCPAVCNPMGCRPPGSSVHGILQEEYWSGLPLPSPGDLPDPGIKPVSPALAGRFFNTEPASNITCHLFV